MHTLYGIGADNFTNTSYPGTGVGSYRYAEIQIVLGYAFGCMHTGVVHQVLSHRPSGEQPPLDHPNPGWQ